MIRYVKLVNYKSLVNLYVDFMKTKTKPKNLVLIYGENGIGKSNFANSFYTLNETMRTMSSIEIFKKIIEKSEAKPNQYKNFIEKHIKDRFKDVKMIINDCKTIDSNGNMLMEYGFICNKKNGIYHIEMNNEEIVSEKLEYVINKNQTYFFDIDKNNVKINASIFTDKNYYNEFLELIDKYWGKHSFLSILSYEIEDKKREYMNKKISKSLYDVLLYLKMMCTKIKGGNHSEFGIIGTQHILMDDLEEGKISIKYEKELDKNEYLINEIFTTLYTDIKNVYYKRTIVDNYIKYKLFSKKMIYGKIMDVDFSLESTGTQNILTLVPYLISACEGQTVIIDELDTGIHDLLVKNLLECIARYVKGQLIITTHNTMLIDSSIPSENIYIFNANSKAEKELIAITDFEGRIHKNNSPRKRYLNGVYGGIPMFTDIDFEELIENLK
ncbi:MAG: AAA family ATPase [Acholeplasma sp.]|nr:AAA family ATPase [Acholeplasma sp.]